MSNPLINMMVKNKMPNLAMFKNMNPKQFILNNLKNSNNKELSKLLNMAESGNMEELKKYADDVFSKQGRNFEEEFSNFMKMIK